MANPTAVSAGDDVLAAWGNLVIDRVVPIFADAAARDAQIPAPENGRLVYVTNQNIFTMYLNGTWLHAGGASLQLADPAATKSAGGLFGRADSGFDLWGTVKVAEFSNAKTTLHRQLDIIDGTRSLVLISKDAPTGELSFDVFGLPVSGGATNVRFDAYGGTPPHFRLAVTSSATRLKSNVASWDDPTVVDRLRPVTYRHADGGDYLGFLAEEVAAAVPHSGDSVEGSIEDYDLRAVVAALVSTVRNLRGRLAALEGAAS